MRCKKFIPVLFLIIYLLFIFYITLYTRSFSLVQSSRLEPFWSYRDINKQNADYLKSAIYSTMYMIAGLIVYSGLETARAYVAEM